MTAPPQKPDSRSRTAPDAPSDREARRAAALRANLGRRKAQARGRDGRGDGSDGADGGEPGRDSGG